MSRANRTKKLAAALEKQSTEIAEMLIKNKVNGYYGVIFALDGEKIYTQELGNVNINTAAKLLTNILDHKVKEITSHGKEERSIH